MKALSIHLFIPILFSTIVFADSRTVLADIATVFKDGKLIEKMELNLSSRHSYAYQDKFDYSTHKSKLIEKLGKGWKENEIDPSQKIAVKDAYRRMKVDYLDHSVFTSIGNRDKEISFYLKRNLIADRQTYIVEINSVDWGAEQVGP